jgi:pyruvate/2-oxoacid:ferredoxin oxidoreductase alpha subunit
VSREFLSGNEAFAYGIRLALPQVISAYPITPQTIVVERLSEMVEDGSLKAEFIHVESEHSALSCAIGASATGARTFTATSSQGLLYMAECLVYASGGRFPFATLFGRQYSGFVEAYRCDDSDYILITLGSIFGLCSDVADELRNEGAKAGVLRLRYIRPFPNEEIAEIVRNAKSIAVLEKDISFGNEGSVYTNVNSALQKAGLAIPSLNFIGGLGGRDISEEDIREIFSKLVKGKTVVHFIGIEEGQ